MYLTELLFILVFIVMAVSFILLFVLNSIIKFLYKLKTNFLKDIQEGVDYIYNNQFKLDYIYNLKSDKNIFLTLKICYIFLILKI